MGIQTDKQTLDLCKVDGHIDRETYNKLHADGQKGMGQSLEKLPNTYMGQTLCRLTDICAKNTEQLDRQTYARLLADRQAQFYHLIRKSSSISRCK